jgi:hypothetical protein
MPPVPQPRDGGGGRVLVLLDADKAEAPEPMNGSSTTPPGGVTSRHSQRISSIGLTVGWVLR